MQRVMCKSKIYGLRITDKRVEYETGSIELPQEVMEIADILPGEMVLVINMYNGERFNTYAIRGEQGNCKLLGGAARLGEIGDKLLVLSYAFMTTDEAKMHTPKMIAVDEKNKLMSKSVAPPQI